MTTLRPQMVKAELQTKVIGKTIHSFRQLTSTNDIAKELAKKGAAEGTVIVADTQTHGRGRLDRTWISPQGGLWFSIILRPKVNPRDAPQLTFMMSVAVAKTINKLYGLKAEIKWPNDVLVNDKKVCGILTETSTKGNLLNYAAVGVGVNANLSLNNLPANLRGSSTTLKDELKREIQLETFLRSLLEEIEHYYNLLTQRKFNIILSEWKQLSRFLGSYVQITSLDEKIEGWATDIDENGALIIKLQDQTTRKIISGDVTVRKRKSG
jgi:BirA family biotin operon repressor/biotin-[acetyl-CoA-carboxylase] ligase